MFLFFTLNQSLDLVPTVLPLSNCAPRNALALEIVNTQYGNSVNPFCMKLPLRKGFAPGYWNWKRARSAFNNTYARAVV